MRTIIIAAIALLSIGAVPGSPALKSAPPSCAFNLPLSPAQCARLRSAGGSSAPSWVSSAGNAKLLYTSEPLEAAVDIWTVGAQIKSSGRLGLAAGSVPLGVTVDSAQSLYVAISSFSSGPEAVDVFPRGATKPSKTYTDGLTGPIDVAVDSHGTLYVANLASPKGGGCGQGSGPGGSVVEYAKGSMTPTRIVSDFIGCPEAIAVDSKSNLYLTYLYYPTSGFVQSDVVEYAYQSTKGKALGLKVPGGPALGGVQVASNGDVVVENVEDDATLNQILTYHPGSTKPSNKIQYPGTGWGTGFKFFALDGNRFFAPAYVLGNYSYVATRPAEFGYPSGDQLLVQKSLSTSRPWAYGFAVTPDN